MSNGMFFCFNHQGKADVLIRAVTARGWEQTRRPAEARFILSDVDTPPHHKRLELYHNQGAKIFLYPHTARPNLFHDFGFDGFAPSPCVTANFVTAQGHVEILETIHRVHRYEVIGWYLCPPQPFQPRAKYRQVLFAPIHPGPFDLLPEVSKRINRETYKRLVPLAQSGQIQLTVRHIRSLEANALWMEPQITYVQVEPMVSYAEIDAADLVISHQTFAYLAVARGVPTLMMGECFPPRERSTREGKYRYARSWDRYQQLLRYPLDILAEYDVLGLFRRAIVSDEQIADWRQRLIGEPFDGDRFVDIVESYL